MTMGEEFLGSFRFFGGTEKRRESVWITTGGGGLGSLFS